MFDIHASVSYTIQIKRKQTGVSFKNLQGFFLKEQKLIQRLSLEKACITKI